MQVWRNGSRLALHGHTARCRSATARGHPPLSLQRATSQRRRSSNVATGTDSISESTSATTITPESGPPEDDKPKVRRSYIRRVEKETGQSSSSATPLPDDLDILWDGTDKQPPPRNELPPEDILQDAFHNLMVCLHPQVQRRSLYSSNSGPPVEPTLALYCPIEGGDYLIDNTIKELAMRTGSDVLFLDAVQLAGGEWGSFGKANALELPVNPLQLNLRNFSSRSSRETENEEEEDDNEGFVQSHSSMTIHVSGFNPRASRPIVVTPAQRNSLASRRKAFFDELINMPNQAASNSTQSELPETADSRPRIVYIRDYPTISSLHSAWFSSLLSAVRGRRQGPISRLVAPVANPTVIIYGISAPIIPQFSQQPARGEWSENSFSQRARERRLRERLRKWERGISELNDELPPSPRSNGIDIQGSSDLPQMIVLPVQGAIGGVLGGIAAGQRSSTGLTSPEEDFHYFRTSVVVPKSRNPGLEKQSRMARRREINELVMRMAIGGVGGTLQKMDSSLLDPRRISLHLSDSAPESSLPMLDRWSAEVEDWPHAKLIADRAVGGVLATTRESMPASIEATIVTWENVHDAWKAQQCSRAVRRLWVEESAEQSGMENDLSGNGATKEEQEPVDEVFETLKHDQNLSPHEKRLLSCFVAPASLTTTFAHVHLPPHTIDSIRSIVSLPLLHPKAFSQGVLKEHSMTGALLFGPPGTGKTLLVRALAKESGARIMIVKPSDVMDMYVGEGEKLVRSVFTLARRLKPCVVFIDEIDSLLGARVTSRDNGGTFALRGVITEFMQEMDGLTTGQEQSVVVIGATNRPYDLDDAVLRRLPRRMLVDLPGRKERESILRIMLRDENLAEDVNLEALSRRTDGFSGSDLKHLCVSAALDAVKQNVALPWLVPRRASDSMNVKGQEQNMPQSSTPQYVEALPPNDGTRILRQANFEKALSEISPSSSESLGSLLELRKWDEQFGEGAKLHHRKLWGRGRFGFNEERETSASSRGHSNVGSNAR